jgi:hypothetical protein
LYICFYFPQKISTALIRDHTGLGFSLNPQLYICFYFHRKFRQRWFVITQYYVSVLQEEEGQYHLYICFYFPQKISTALVRDHTGLGFSIAGGRESIPFKCNDQICSQYYSIITWCFSYWPSYWSEACCIDLRRSRTPIQQTEDL